MKIAPEASVDDDAETPTACAGCGAHAPEVFFEIPRVPANVGTLARSFNDARTAQQGAIRLAACERCGLIQNQLFDPATVGFEPGYQVSLFHSMTFREYIQGVAKRLIERYDLHGKEILEIGCGDGEFLRLICREGKNRGVGVDPTIAAGTEESVGEGAIRLVPGYFSAQHERYIGDFICCLSVFEAIAQPLKFLQSLRKSIGDRGTPVYFEVFNGFRSIVNREVWSVHYEQGNYFSLESLSGLFQRSGFRVTDAGTCYQGDQYLYVEARPVRAGTGKPEESDFHEMISAVRSFQTEYGHRHAWWQQTFDQWSREKKKVAVWGSGGKGISFLSALPNTDAVQCVVDVNPDRQNFYIPLSGHKIVDPVELKQIRPDAVILTNPLYQKEITQQLEQMEIRCEILVA